MARGRLAVLVTDALGTWSMLLAGRAPESEESA
jgi:hypothetical protein